MVSLLLQVGYQNLPIFGALHEWRDRFWERNVRWAILISLKSFLAASLPVMTRAPFILTTASPCHPSRFILMSPPDCPYSWFCQRTPDKDLPCLWTFGATSGHFCAHFRAPHCGFDSMRGSHRAEASTCILGSHDDCGLRSFCSCRISARSQELCST